MAFFADRLGTPREMLGPQRAGFVLGDDFPIFHVPKFPFSIAARRGQRPAVGTPRQRVATVRMRLPEEMDCPALRRIVNRHLARDGGGGEPPALRRPGGALRPAGPPAPDEPDRGCGG